MFIQLECCEKCFMHKQYNHNEWAFHDNYCKLDQTIQRKCKLKTLKNIKLPQAILNELEHYDFHQHQIVDQIIDSQKEKIKPEIETFEIKYKGVYVFSLGETKNFPDYNLVAKILLALKKAEPTQIMLIIKEMRIYGFVGLYELVKAKFENVHQKNIKLKSIQELLPQKEFKRTQFSASKQKRAATHKPQSIHQNNQKIPKQLTSMEDPNKDRNENQYIFKLKDGTTALLKPSVTQKLKSIGRGSQKLGRGSGRGSGNMSLPKISNDQLLAKKRQQKRIRCKKFSNRYSNMTKNTDIINKLVKSEYGRIKQEKYEFLSKVSDVKGDSDYSDEFDLDSLSDTSQEEQNIFRNGSNFARVSCTQLLNELCKIDERPRKFEEASQSNLGPVHSTQSLDKTDLGLTNQFDYQYDSRQKLNEYDQIEFNMTVNSMKQKEDYSEKLILEPIRQTQDEKWENNSFNSSMVNNKLAQIKSITTSRMKESKMGERLTNKQVRKSLEESQTGKQSSEEANIHKSQKTSRSSKNYNKQMKDGVKERSVSKSKEKNRKSSNFSQESDEENKENKEIEPESQKSNLNRSRFKQKDRQSPEVISLDSKKLSPQARSYHSKKSPSSSQHRNSIHNETQTSNKELLLTQNGMYAPPVPFNQEYVCNRFSLESRHSQTEDQLHKQGVKNGKLPWQNNSPKQTVENQASPQKFEEEDFEVVNMNENSSAIAKNTSNQSQKSPQKTNQKKSPSKSPMRPSKQHSLLQNYFIETLQNLPEKITSFNKLKSDLLPSQNQVNPKKDQTNEVENFLTQLYPCPKILIQTKNKKKISKIIQNFIDPYLEQVEQSQKQQKEWVELTETNVCKIFILQPGEVPKKIETILWNQENPMNTRLCLTRPEEEFQTFIELGQLHKEYSQILFLFYDHKFELSSLPFEVISQKLSISSKEKCNKKYSFELNIGEKYFTENEDAENEPNHIFIAFEAKDTVGDSQEKLSKEMQLKLKALNLDEPESELEIKIEVYEKLEECKKVTNEDLIGTIEKKGKFFFELNLEKGCYKFDITMRNVDFKKGEGRKMVELLFYSEAEVGTSKVREVYE